MDSDPDPRFDDALRGALRSLSMELTLAQRTALRRHYHLVIDANRRFNLTRITEPAEFAVKHHADSLAVVAWARDAGHSISEVLDIGTGAGLPAVPLAVARPDWHVTALDGTGKKARFVAAVADDLGLSNLDVCHDRAETWHGRQPFDLVVFKAIGPLARCIHYAAPHTIPGGWVVVYKTASVSDDESTSGLTVADTFAFSPPSVYRYDLPLDDHTLHRVLWGYRSLVSGN